MIGKSNKGLYMRATGRGMALAFALGTTTTSALAQDVTLSGQAGVVSDYRFRGLSRSSNDPAVQAGVEASATSGWYAGAWASSVAGLNGADAEIDLYAGHGGRVAGLDYTIGAQAYLFPGADNRSLVELQGSLGTTIGPANIQLRVAYAPDQARTVRDNLYIGARTDIGVPGTPFTVRLRAGRENGLYDEKWDWEAGVVWSRNWLSLSAAYIDSNYSEPHEAGKRGKGTLIGAVTARF